MSFKETFEVETTIKIKLPEGIEVDEDSGEVFLELSKSEAEALRDALNKAIPDKNSPTIVINPSWTTYPGVYQTPNYIPINTPITIPYRGYVPYVVSSTGTSNGGSWSTITSNNDSCSSGSCECNCGCAGNNTIE